MHKMLEERLQAIEARLERLESIATTSVILDGRGLKARMDEQRDVNKACTNCGRVGYVHKRNEREWCTLCGYKNWTDDVEGPIGL